MLHHIQIKLFQLEKSELEKLSKESRDEAVRIALQLSKYPAPPMPEFELDSKYKDGETLQDLIDDVFKNVDDKKDIYGYSYGSKDGSKNKKSYDMDTLTDTESTKLCNEWKSNYNVVVGVSWGNLPYDLQQKWLHYSCDYHLGDGAGIESSNTIDFENVQNDELTMSPTLDNFSS